MANPLGAVLSTDEVISGANATDLTDGGATTLHTHASSAACKYPFEARLTLETGVPISTTNQTAKDTLYLTAYEGNQIATYSSGTSSWSNIDLDADISISLAGKTAALPYDVFVYDNAGTLTLELLAWTNTTTRATALALQDGVYVKSGDAARRYCGTICIKATGECEDSTTSRLLWNYYNRVPRNMYCVDTTNSWTYTTATWRAANNNTTLGVGRVDCVIGVAEDEILATNMAYAQSSYTSGVGIGIGVGINSTSANSAQILAGAVVNVIATIGQGLYDGALPVGYSYLQKLEYSVATGTTTWFGDAGLTVWQTGMRVKIYG